MLILLYSTNSVFVTATFDNSFYACYVLCMLYTAFRVLFFVFSPHLPAMYCCSHDALLLAVYLYVNTLESHWSIAIICSLPAI